MFLKDYALSVLAKTSPEAANDETLSLRSAALAKLLNGNYARLDNAVAGIAGEAGEVMDIWKKVKFHGKEWNSETKDHMINELGDVLWYITQASLALEVPLEEIIRRNIEKLEKRHQHGFSSSYLKDQK